ncbi:MAG TPA: hypothetical protein VGG21_05090 [Acidimicrobiales bacterium]|jgi:hypothetical protein
MASSLPLARIESTVFCVSCLDELAHCHGVAIIRDEMVTCSEDPDCRLGYDLHEFVSYLD